nr:hypothetical protein GCM10020092_052890 [Actinoplanes digitatis]
MGDDAWVWSVFRTERAMCRWLAYSGSPILLEELLYKPQYSLINQSLHSRLGVEPTNGDGFGVGWYGVDRTLDAALFRGVGPAWGDPNLRELAGHISSPLFLAHIRASTGTPVQHTNSHPFRHGRWMWVHNGAIREFPKVKRDLVLAVDPALYTSIAGSTDSEVMFYLALTFGLRENPVEAVQRMVGFVEATGRAVRRGVSDPDERRHHRRREVLGLPLLQRGREPVAVLQHRHDRAAAAASGGRGAAAHLGGDPHRRLGAAG